jgi:hypothetical protein
LAVFAECMGDLFDRCMAVTASQAPSHHDLRRGIELVSCVMQRCFWRRGQPPRMTFINQSTEVVSRRDIERVIKTCPHQ